MVNLFKKNTNLGHKRRLIVLCRQNPINHDQIQPTDVKDVHECMAETFSQGYTDKNPSDEQ